MEERIKEEKLRRITSDAISKMGDELQDRLEGKALNGHDLVEFLTKHFIGYALCVFADDHREREAVLTAIATSVAHALVHSLDQINEAEAEEKTKH